MRVDVDLSQDILDWIISQLQLSFLPKKISDKLLLWKNGEKKPTYNQIEEVSKTTGIPLGYFFLKTPPKEDYTFINYRTIDSINLKKPSRNLIDIIHDMGNIQDWMRNDLIFNGTSSCHYVGLLKDEKNLQNFAKQVREILNLDLDWFNKTKNAEGSFNLIRDAISASGTIVMMSGIVANNTHRPLDIEEFRAFAMVDEYAPLIFINSNDSINSRIFSLLHEFAHICLGENSLFNDRYSSSFNVKFTETICNAVAAEVMVPQEYFIKEWGEIIKAASEEETIEILAKKFKCGITVIARRALDNRLIENNLYKQIAGLAVQRFNEAKKRRKENKEGGGDYYVTLARRVDNRFLKMLSNSVYEGRTLYTDAFRLTNTNRHTYSNLVAIVGGGD